MEDTYVLVINKKINRCYLWGTIKCDCYEFFLIPADVYASGFAGVAQLISKITPISTGILLFILNVPIAIVGWIKVGKSFTFFSF